MSHSDNSLPPIGTSLRYQRQDGAVVTLAIEPPGTPLPPTAPPEMLQSPPEVAPRGNAPKVVRSFQRANKPAGAPVVARPGFTPVTTGLDPAALDHPDVGSRFTIFILFYGGDEYHQMHKRCLESLLATVPAHRMDLRVGSNAIGPQTLALLSEHAQKGTITKHYLHPENAFKYPVMREMFHDPAHPIRTKWVIWFDDDSMANRDPNWLTALAQAIVARHRRNNVHMLGAKFIWNLTPSQRAVFQSRPWYAKRPFRAGNGKPSPNGNKVFFCAGGFWALSREALVQADIPDLGTGLQNNGGDWQIGEQLYQAGYELGQFNTQKQFVHTSSEKRRGVTTPGPGSGRPGIVQATKAPVVPPRQTPPGVRSARRGLVIVKL